MRKRVATLILTLAGVLGFTFGLLLAPAPADAACKLICCPGGTHCIECCQAPCPTLVCPPW